MINERFLKGVIIRSQNYYNNMIINDLPVSLFLCLCLSQYKIVSSDISSHTIWLSVWDHDRFGRNQFLGEIYLPLSSLDLNNTQQWYTLLDRVSVCVCLSLSVHMCLCV